MTKSEIIKFLNNNKNAVLATSENNTPHLRFVWTVKTDEKGIMFHTGKMKDLYKQLIANPYVEFCFYNAEQNIQIRVHGKVKPIEDMELKKDLVRQRPFLKATEEKMGGLDFLTIFYLENCKAYVWTMETNLESKKYINLCE